ncbi:MAG: glycosyltransferase family 2 protein [Elusimicrobiota bacterium]
MKPRPRVSVIIPVHNRIRLVRRAIASVFAQTFSDFEVVVVDDCSTDGTADALAAWRSDLRLIRLARNQGPAAARNAGLAAARGELAAFLDSDDVWRPAKLARQIARFDDPSVVCAHSEIDLSDASGRIVRRGHLAHVRPLYRDAPGWRGHEFVAISTAVVRRRAARAVGFDPGFAAASGIEDADFFIRLQVAFGRSALRFDARALAVVRRSEFFDSGRSRGIDCKLDLLHWHMKNERGAYG